MEDAVTHAADPVEDPEPYTVSFVVALNLLGGIRKEASAHLERWGMTAATSAVHLIVTELLTNVFKHTDSHRARLRMRPGFGYVYIEVADTSHERPVIGHADADAESGRGMLMVSAYSMHLETVLTKAGKRVCCTIPIPVEKPDEEPQSHVAHAAS
jgi:two-component sensor histidine kinase